MLANWLNGRITNWLFDCLTDWLCHTDWLTECKSDISLLFSFFLSFVQYDEYKNPMDNIGMQDSLLSRFDLLFIVLDQVRQTLKKDIVVNECDSKTLFSMH